MKISSNGKIVNIPINNGINFTPGDGLALMDDVLDLTNGVQGILTKEEFDALPEDQKNKGTYFINNGSYPSSTFDVYSTKEQMVGLWIDGKPLYRKVVTGNTTPTLNVSTTVATVDNAEFKSINNGYFVSKSDYIMPLAVGYDANSVCVFYADANGNIISVVKHANYANCPFFIIALYTKTTDASTTPLKIESSSVNSLPSLDVSYAPTSSPSAELNYAPTSSPSAELNHAPTSTASTELY